MRRERGSGVGAPRGSELPLFAYRRCDASGAFLWAERGAQSVTGWRPAELCAGAAGYWDLLWPERRERIAAEIGAALCRRRDFGLVYSLRRRDGSRTVVVDRGSRGGATGEIEGWICQLSGIPAADRELDQAHNLRTAMALTNEVILQLDHEGRVLDVTPNCERVFGNRRDQVLGRSGVEMAREQDRELIRESMRRLLPGGPPASFTVRLADRGARSVWIEGTVALFHDAAGGGRYAAVVRDVSERQERTRALAESEAKFAAAFQSSPVGMSLTSLDGEELIEANPSFWRMLGLDPTWTPERDVRMRSIWARDQRKQPTLARLRRSGAFEGRARFDLLSGEQREMRISARRVWASGRELVLWQLVDMTDELLAQRALCEKDLLYRRLIESCPLGIATLDTEQRITTANAALRKLVGAPDGQSLAGCEPRALMGQTWKSVERDLEAAVAGGERRTFEVVFQTPWQRWIQLRAHLAPLEDADGEQSGALAVVEDVGEWRRMEDQLRHSQKMEAVGQLAAGVAHDFQNWLLVIDSCAQELEAGLPAGEPLQRAASRIRRATRGATGLAQQLLSFGRVSRLLPCVVDVGAALTRSQSLWRTLVPDVVRIELDLGAQPLHVWADPAGVDQVFLNLVINARDALPEGGSISIAARAVATPEAGLASPLDLPPGRYVQISVSDDGSGMARDVRERIFEPFFTTKPAGAGSGLGLAMVQAIVIESGGRIRVDERVGGGSRFDVYLPAACRDGPRDVPTQPAR